MFVVPEGLVSATSMREGAAGSAWLARLPSLVARCLEKWGCELDGDPGHGEVALVVPVRRVEGTAAVKISFPHPDTRSEGPALRRFDGHGAIRLLEADEDASALLLERAGPRTLDSLAPVEEAIEVAGDLARRLAVPADSTAPALADTTGGWGAELDRQLAAAPGLLAATVIDRAKETIRALARDTTPTMIHGDLHFGNVLSAEREPWLAIDPKGWRGTAAYDAFTVVGGGRDAFKAAPNRERALRDRIRRFASSAGVSVEDAVACTQARATSSYLYQRLQRGDWFDLEFLRTAAELGSPGTT